MTCIDPCKFKGLLFFILILIIGVCYGQFRKDHHPAGNASSYRITGMHTLSIHTRDTNTVVSIYRFLKEKLKLPVYYTPVTIGARKYAGIYAGNMVLEPCGPYENRHYATDEFRAIFFGVNLSVNDPLNYFDQLLNELNISHQVNQGSIYILDSLLSLENIFTALYEIGDKNKRDSLRNLLASTSRSPGIQYISEIEIGYQGEENIRRWKEYLSPLEFEDDVCRVNDSLRIRFERDRINEVRSITFKVKSLNRARQYFEDNRVKFSDSVNLIRLDPDGVFGLTVLIE